MKLIVGLGNPGKQYEKTWHNVGFLAMDKLADNFPKFKMNKKFKAEMSEGSLNDEKIILAKPQTFMNKSGEAVYLLTNFYKIKPKDILIIHDDIDLPLGKIRISKNSSAGGHNGIKSIIEKLGTKDFVRFRIGIRQKITDKMPADKYVLQKIELTSKMQVGKSLKNTVEAIEVYFKDGIDKAMNEFN